MSSSLLQPAVRAATPMAFVRAIVRGYERYGMDPSGGPGSRHRLRRAI